MPKNIFINLPCADLPASIDFFTALGYSFNPQFTDDSGTCMIVSDHIYVMLLSQEKFSGFSPNPVANARDTTEVLIALDCDSREEVDATIQKAVAAGGNTYNEPQDHGFMYAHAFQDLDGHVWEVFFMESMPPQ
ncbi:hypothetical protein TDB9533_00211 [Thalassocella blandensis]|nr:hypothetical protein TDB9533_00211 [Thalassocella blandensis]